MQASTDAIKALREQTSAGIMECKRALEDAGGDFDAAVCALTERGYAIAKKKEDRVAEQGLIEAYVHPGGKFGALVELNCESDFVAHTEEFRQLAHDLAMQVVGACPRFVGPDEAPAGAEVADEDFLLSQPFIKEPTKKVEDLIAEMVAKVRENVRVKRFARFELGCDGQDEG
jgi:elongation factor Ts